MSAPLCGINENGQLEKSYIADGMPIGAVFPFYGTTPPAHTLACNGAAISRTAYAELFAVIGTTAGAGDGSTTFNVPDLRGMFIRGTGGNAAALGVEQGDAIRNFVGHAQVRAGVTHDGIRTDIFNYSTGVLNISLPSDGGGAGVAPAGFVMEYGTPIVYSDQDFDIDASRNIPTAAENRPVNVAMTYCIIYEN